MERSLKDLLHIHTSGSHNTTTTTTNNNNNSSSYSSSYGSSSSSSISTSLGEQDGIIIITNEDSIHTQALAAMATTSSTTKSPLLHLGPAKQTLRSESSKSSNHSKCSTSSEESDLSNDSMYRSFVTAISKPHKANNDSRWEAIQAAHSREGKTLSLESFRLLKQLGSGDIGSVYLAELRGSNPCSYFAMKVMDKSSLASRKKLLRAQTEREILQCLDHPFLPSLYTHFETDKFSCVVMEFCSGGDLHMLRQRQHGKRFSEGAAKFYAAEVLLALEYLHMMGVIYRDLKPENVLVREDGHIMLSDFDLSLQCVVNPTLLKAPTTISTSRLKGGSYCVQPSSCLLETTSSCAIPSCIQPTCFLPRILPSFKLKPSKKRAPRADGIVVVGNQITPLPELVAEPTSARSLSFVGTHEYLAPEIIKGEGHGSAVDWWTFGIFLYELLYGRTPFKGAANRATLFNVIGQPLKFPDSPGTSFEAKDLIRGLLVKDPQHRLAYKKGATEIKQHAFFEGVNWALIRSMVPPQVPKPFQLDFPSRKAPPQSSSTSHLDFDFF